MKPLLKYVLLINVLFALLILVSWVSFTLGQGSTPGMPEQDKVVFAQFTNGDFRVMALDLLGVVLYFFPFVVLFFTLFYLYKQTSWRSFFKSLLIPFSYTFLISVLVWYLVYTKLTSSSLFWYGLIWGAVFIQVWITLGVVIVASALFVFGRNYLLPSLGLQKRKR